VTDPAPNSARARYELADKALLAGAVEEAESICRAALAPTRADPNIVCLLGEICLRQRRAQEAENWFARVLARHPADARALEGLGLSQLASGRPARAAETLRRAVERAPGRATTRVALARALAEAGEGEASGAALAEAFRLNPRKAAMAEAERALRDGRREDAEKTLRELLAADPRHVKAIRLLAGIALEANRHRAALRLAERAVELAPGVATGWTDLANIHLKRDDYDTALAAVERAIAIDPGFAHALVVRGNILTRALRHEEAVAAYRGALEISPHSTGALAGLGHVLKTIGRQAEAIEAFREAIRLNPAFGEAYWSLANLKTFRFEPDEVRAMEGFVESEGLADEPRVNMLVALGKHYDHERDYDRAFDCYRRGNDLRRGHEIYDPVQTQVVHDRIIRVFDRAFFAAREGYGDPSPDPILIVGLPRSGSTLIEQILASHSQVEGTMELPDLGRVIAGLNARTPGRAEYPEAVAPLDAAQAAALGREYLDATRRYRHGRPFFIDKMPNNFQAIGFLRLVLPNAKVIDARRHPLDSCLGSYKQLFFKGQSFTYDLFELGHYYLEYRRVMDHWAEVLPGFVLTVDYEEMVRDQEAQTRRLLEFCGLPWEERCLRFWETERAVHTASSEQVRQPLYSGAINAWRHYERHIGELVGVLEPLLRQLPEADRPEALRTAG